MNEKTSILLVDDHAMLRKGLRMLIEQEQDFLVSGEAADGLEAIEKVRELQPDVVIMDINMPNLNGIEATREVLNVAPGTRIMALSIHSSKRYVEEMLEAGVAGYLLKESAPEELIAAIYALRDGKGYLSTDITEIVLTKVRESVSASVNQADRQNDPDTWQKPELPEGLTYRRDLIRCLESGKHKPLTMVVAPAGFGKSVLVSDWLTRHPREYRWLSFDLVHNDLHQFLAYWVAMTEDLFTNQSRYLPALVESANRPPTSILAGALLAELKEYPQNLTVIMENMHLLSDKSIYDLLSQVLKNFVENKYFVIISRQDPFLPLSLLRSNNNLNELRTEDLRLTVEDVQSYLENALGRPVDVDTATTWQERTEGWIAGLQLAVHNLADTAGVDPGKNSYGSGTDWRKVLTNREYEIMLLLNDRLRDKEIADRLCISVETVKSHLRNIYGKVHASNRRDAVIKAQQLNIL